MKLVLPSRLHYHSYVSAIEEYEKHGVDTYDFMDVTKYDIFERFENFKNGKNLPSGYVKSTYLWFVHDEKFIGEASIRHSLTDSLLRFGGHIGYGVRYSEWNKGYGTIMLSETLRYARKNLFLDRILITCNDTNIGSARIIEKNGGVLQDKIINVIDGSERLTRRYWIDNNG